MTGHFLAHQHGKEAVRHEGDAETGRGNCLHKNRQPEAVPFRRGRRPVRKERYVPTGTVHAGGIGTGSKDQEANKKSRLLRRACFPVMKSFEGYDYGDIQLPPALGRQELEDAAFIEEKENLVLYGPVGTGKTHMAIAAGIRACNKGYRVRFYTVTELVLALSASKREGTLDKLQKELAAADLLILDEWGYVPVDREGAQLLFRVIADSYENRSLILTTNIEFSKWGAYSPMTRWRQQ